MRVSLIIPYTPGMDIFGKRRSDREALARVKTWALELLEAGPDDSIVVNEISCDDPDCPPHETVLLIARMGQPTVQLKVPKPADQVLLVDLQAALNTEGPLKT